MKTVRNLLNEKGGEVWSTSADSPVVEALRQMALHDVGALVVLDGERLVGIISERDYARKVILKGKASKEMPVGDIMSSDVITVHPSQSVAECMALMTRKHIRHLPVVENDCLVGVISIRDVVQVLLAEQEAALQKLERAVIGSEELLS